MCNGYSRWNTRTVVASRRECLASVRAMVTADGLRRDAVRAMVTADGTTAP
jgi:hypothetical protein